MINNRSSIQGPVKNSLVPQNDQEEDIFEKDKDFYKIDQLKLSNKKQNIMKLGWAIFATLFFLITMIIAKQQSDKIEKFFESSSFTENYMDNLIQYMNDNDLELQPIMLFDLKTIQLAGKVYLYCAIVCLIAYNIALLIRKRFICCAKYRNFFVNFIYFFCIMTVLLFITWWYANYDVLHKEYEIKSSNVSLQIKAFYQEFLKGINGIIFADFDSTFETNKSSLYPNSQEDLKDVYDQTKKCSMLPLYMFIMFIIILAISLVVVYFIKNTENRAFLNLIKQMYIKFQKEPKCIESLNSKVLNSLRSSKNLENNKESYVFNKQNNKDLNIELNNQNKSKQMQKKVEKHFENISPIYPQQEENKDQQNIPKQENLENSKQNQNKRQKQNQIQDQDQQQKLKQQQKNKDYQLVNDKSEFKSSQTFTQKTQEYSIKNDPITNNSNTQMNNSTASQKSNYSRKNRQQFDLGQNDPYFSKNNLDNSKNMNKSNQSKNQDLPSNKQEKPLNINEDDTYEIPNLETKKQKIRASNPNLQSLTNIDENNYYQQQ